MIEKLSHLRALRQASGMSLRELARKIGEHPSNVSFWETSGTLPRSDVLLPMSKALSVSVEELLGEANATKKRSPRGKLATVFDQVSQLPRREQQKIVEVVQALVAQSNGS